jgi:hypothetical protein
MERMHLGRYLMVVSWREDESLDASDAAAWSDISAV